MLEFAPTGFYDEARRCWTSNPSFNLLDKVDRVLRLAGAMDIQKSDLKYINAAEQSEVCFCQGHHCNSAESLIAKV